MMSKHVTTTKGLSHFMLFLLRLLALALFIYSVSLVFTSNFRSEEHTSELQSP